MDKLFFNDEHFMLVEMVREFAQNEIKPHSQTLDATGEFPTEIIQKMGDLGLMGIPIPERYGGAGMDTAAYAAVVMELARVDAAVAITLAAHTSLGTMPILLAGNEEQKATYLPRLASGTELGAFGLTEPEAGSDAGATKTTAVKDGEEYLVNGSKIFITNAGQAGLLNFTAQIIEDGQKQGIGAFIIPTDTPNLSFSPPEKKMGWKASDTRQIFFKDVRVAATNMLGQPGKGFKTFLKTLTAGRISIAALAVGTAQGAFDLALNYATEREAFGKKIYELEAIGAKLATMATEIQAAKLLVFHTAWLKDHGKTVIKEAAMAKLFSSEVAMRTTIEAIQIHGGYGYVKEYDVERFFRDAKVLEIGEGTSEIQRLIITRELVKALRNA